MAGKAAVEEESNGYIVVCQRSSITAAAPGVETVNLLNTALSCHIPAFVGNGLVTAQLIRFFKERKQCLNQNYLR